MFMLADELLDQPPLILNDRADLDESDQDSLADDDHTIQSFTELNLSHELLEAIAAMGWNQPTEVQKMCLAPAIKQHDVLGFAQTGTGKTGVFLITIAQLTLNQRSPDSPPAAAKKASAAQFYPKFVVIAPTRELVMQIHEEYTLLARQLPSQANLIIGGVDMDAQITKLKNHHHIIMATPGRLKDFVQKNIIALSQVELFVCDEVDRMFEIGFLSEVEYFLSCINDQAQKLMFSATSNETLEELTFEYLNQPKVINITPDAITSDRITQSAILCSSHNKLKVFVGLLKDHNPDRALIFVNMKVTAAWLHEMLKANDIESSLITGDLPQRKRTSLIRNIKAGRIRLLIATDVASRGLHIPAVTHVYNFDLPAMAANYIHRIGRTARAGAKGYSCSLVCDEYGSHLLAINELLGEPVACEWFPPSYLNIKLNIPAQPAPAKLNISSKSASPSKHAQTGQPRQPGAGRRSIQQQAKKSSDEDGAPTTSARPKRHRRKKASPPDSRQSVADSRGGRRDAAPGPAAGAKGSKKRHDRNKAKSMALGKETAKEKKGKGQITDQGKKGKKKDVGTTTTKGLIQRWKKWLSKSPK